MRLDELVTLWREISGCEREMGMINKQEVTHVSRKECDSPPQECNAELFLS